MQLATLEDLPKIYWLFEEAIAYQKGNGFVGWQTYDKEYLTGDVEKGLLYKICKAEEIVCIYCVCYTDHLIWRDKEKGDAVYVHRVVVHPAHRGERYFQQVMDWTAMHALQLQRRYVRIDTWANNDRIIDYYKGYGFEFIENYTTPDNPHLPDQHRNLNVALLQYEI